MCPGDVFAARQPRLFDWPDSDAGVNDAEPIARSFYDDWVEVQFADLREVFYQ